MNKTGIIISLMVAITFSLHSQSEYEKKLINEVVKNWSKAINDKDYKTLGKFYEDEVMLNEYMHNKYYCVWKIKQLHYFNPGYSQSISSKIITSKTDDEFEAKFKLISEFGSSDIIMTFVINNKGEFKITKVSLPFIVTSDRDYYPDQVLSGCGVSENRIVIQLKDNITELDFRNLKEKIAKMQDFRPPLSFSYTGYPLIESETILLSANGNSFDVNILSVSLRFFESASLDILNGRNFLERDKVSSEGVAIVNDAFLDDFRFNSGSNAIGNYFQSENGEKYLIIGTTNLVGVTSCDFFRPERSAIVLEKKDKLPNFIIVDLRVNRSNSELMKSKLQQLIKSTAPNKVLKISLFEDIQDKFYFENYK